MHTSIGSTNGRIIAVMLLAVLAACGGETNVVPPRDLIQGQGRIVSSVIDAGGPSYIVDEIYTPSEDSLAAIAAGPDGNIWFTGVAGGRPTDSLAHFGGSYLFGATVSKAEHP